MTPVKVVNEFHNMIQIMNSFADDETKIATKLFEDCMNDPASVSIDDVMQSFDRYTSKMESQFEKIDRLAKIILFNKQSFAADKLTVELAEYALIMNARRRCKSQKNREIIAGLLMTLI